MALSNVLREPRRELIEQSFGTLVIGVFIGLDYVVASWVYTNLLGPDHIRGDFFFAMFLATMAIVGGIFVLFFIHWIGEGVCAAMAQRGYDP